MIALLMLSSIATVQSNDIDSYVQKNFKDVTFTARKRLGDQRELKKINDDFGQSYRFDYTNVSAKEPFKLRLDSNVEDTSVVYILNGPALAIKVPKLRVNSKQDLTKAPGRRTTVFDFGMVTPALMTFFDAKFVRMDRATGDAVFDFTFPPETGYKARNRVWIDTERKIIKKREWFNQEDRQLATFTFENPTQIGGVWFSTKMTVRNTDNKVAGIMQYENFKVNTGLSDDLFIAK